MFQDDLPHPCTICVPSSKSSFLDDCRKSRGDHVVGLVTCSSAPISKQRVSQRTNNKHLLPSSHRVGEKQEQTRGKKGKSETQLICQAPSLCCLLGGRGSRSCHVNFPISRCDEDKIFKLSCLKMRRGRRCCGLVRYKDMWHNLSQIKI